MADRLLYARHPAGRRQEWEFGWDQSASGDVDIGKAPKKLGAQPFVSDKSGYHTPSQLQGPSMFAPQTKFLSMASAL